MSKQEVLKVYEDRKEALEKKWQDTTNVDIMIQDLKREIEYLIKNNFIPKENNNEKNPL
jgi:hypothetical protein